MPELSAVEEKVLHILLQSGPIFGTAQVGHALWPERPLQPQGAAIAVGGILRRLAERGLVGISRVGPVAQYSVTIAGACAHTAALQERVDHRQLTLPI